MYIWPPRTTGIYWNIVEGWNFVDYTINMTVQYRNGYWIIYLKSLNFEIIEKVKSIMYIRLKTT